jgi:HlyD family secretion protein
MPNGRRHPHRVLLATLALATLAAFPRLSSADEAVPADTGVLALGRIEPDSGILLVSVPSTPEAINGPVVSKLFVKAGDDVTKGQILAETDAAAVEDAFVAESKAELVLAESQAEAAGGAEQEACSRADVARRTSARRTNLRKSGVTSDEETDVAAGDAKALSGACTAARMATRAAAAGVDVARAKLHRREIAADRCRVRAPIDGRILRIVANPGEWALNEGLLRMGDVKRMKAIAEVYETDIGRVRLGQKATVTSRALKAPLSGTVDHIRLEVRKQDATGTDPASRKDARIVEVEVLLDDPTAVAGLSNLQVDVLIRP